MTLESFNQLDRKSAESELLRCCGSSAWVNKMLKRRPFPHLDNLLSMGEQIWDALEKQDWLESFSHHPKIGDLHSLKKKYSSTRVWAAGEQSGMQEAESKTIDELASGNKSYEDKFGYIFIVCATGKSAEQMLMLLKERLNNTLEEELVLAANEQMKITNIRLKKLLS